LVLQQIPAIASDSPADAVAAEITVQEAGQQIAGSQLALVTTDASSTAAAAAAAAATAAAVDAHHISRIAARKLQQQQQQVQRSNNAGSRHRGIMLLQEPFCPPAVSSAAYSQPRSPLRAIKSKGVAAKQPHISSSSIGNSRIRQGASLPSHSAAEKSAAKKHKLAAGVWLKDDTSAAEALATADRPAAEKHRLAADSYLKNEESAFDRSAVQPQAAAAARSAAVSRSLAADSYLKNEESTVLRSAVQLQAAAGRSAGGCSAAATAHHCNQAACGSSSTAAQDN
jgi:hypothetical protein